MRRTLQVVFLLLVLPLSVARCGGGSPTEPSAKSPQVVVYFTGAPFTANVEGRTISADGPFTIHMTAGTHEISGTFTSGLMVIVFGGGFAGAGGVQSGSVISVEGVFPQVQSCALGWGDFTRVSRSFRVRFTVTTNALAACQ